MQSSNQQFLVVSNYELCKELCQLSIKIKVLVDVIFSIYDFYKTQNDIEITLSTKATQAMK
jgi:hypothetical protein